MYCVRLLRYGQSLALSKYSHTLCDVRVLYEILCAVQHQRIGDTVLFCVFHHIAAEKAEVNHMNFRIVLHGELGKGVAVGVLDEQQLAALSTSLDNGLCLIGIQEHSVLVAAIKVY